MRWPCLFAPIISPLLLASSRHCTRHRSPQVFLHLISWYNYASWEVDLFAHMEMYFSPSSPSSHPWGHFHLIVLQPSPHALFSSPRKSFTQSNFNAKTANLFIVPILLIQIWPTLSRGSDESTYDSILGSEAGFSFQPEWSISAAGSIQSNSTANNIWLIAKSEMIKDRKVANQKYFDKIWRQMSSSIRSENEIYDDSVQLRFQALQTPDCIVWLFVTRCSVGPTTNKENQSSPWLMNVV